MSKPIALSIFIVGIVVSAAIIMQRDHSDRIASDAEQDRVQRTFIAAYDPIRYFHDPRVDLCFMRTGFSQDRTISNVPCTQLVLNAIREDAKRWPK